MSLIVLAETSPEQARSMAGDTLKDLMNLVDGQDLEAWPSRLREAAAQLIGRISSLAPELLGGEDDGAANPGPQ